MKPAFTYHEPTVVRRPVGVCQQVGGGDDRRETDTRSVGIGVVVVGAATETLLWIVPIVGVIAAPKSEMSNDEG